MKAHIYLIVSQSRVDTHINLSQRELKVGKLYFNHTINQHSSNEAHFESTDCNSDLEAGQ